MTSETAATLIGQRFGVTVASAARDLTVAVPPNRWVELATCARDELACRFFSFSTAVDLKDEGLEVVARVENLDAPFALTMKTRLEPGVTRCASLVALYRGANWMERECFEMFGITFDGHPDLRRLLLPEDWQGFPLLKSYDVDTPYPPYR